MARHASREVSTSHPTRFLLQLALGLSAAPLLPGGGAAAQGSVGGTLTPAGVTLENAHVALRVYQDPSNAKGQEVEFELTDLDSGHVQRHVDWGLWELQLNTLPVPGPGVSFVDLLPEHASGPVQFTQGVSPALQELVLLWPACVLPGTSPSEAWDVRLHVLLPEDAHDTRWRLSATPLVSNHGIRRGRIALSFENSALDDLGGAGSWKLLTSLGFLVDDPLAALETDAELWYDTEIRPQSQGNAVYDGAGNGSYVAFMDSTGMSTKGFRIGVSPARDALRMQCDNYSHDLSDPTLVYQGLPLRIGRFQGDWWDLADVYRTWLDGTAITARGLLATRSDVPDILRHVQHQMVFSPLDDYFTPCGGVEPKLDFLTQDTLAPLASFSSNVAERAQSYADHWGLDSVAHLQFAAVWPFGEYQGVGLYQLSPQWEQSIQQFEDAGLLHLLYLFDSWYRTTDENPVQQSYLEQGWIDETIVRIDGTPFLADRDLGPVWGVQEFAMIHGRTPKWITRLTQLGEQLGQLGVDGVFIDNFFPDLTNASFTTSQGGTPGYGPTHTQAFTAPISAIRKAARQHNPHFTVYSEVMFESFLRHTDLFSPVQASADLLSGDERTSYVPLGAMLYHHYALLGPSYAGWFTRLPTEVGNDPFCPGFGPLPDSVFSDDPVARGQARLGANYLNAFGWVNGSPIWTPDLGASNPKCVVWSHEIPPPAPGFPNCFEEYQAVCAYAARLSQLRGNNLAGHLLAVGRRERDLPLLDPVPEFEVQLTPVFEGQADTQRTPALLQGVWSDPTQPGELGVALANFTDEPLEPNRLEVDRAAYGLSTRRAHLIERVDETGVWHHARIEAGEPFRIEVPALPAESRSFLWVHPAQEPSETSPIEGEPPPPPGVKKP